MLTFIFCYVDCTQFVNLITCSSDLYQLHVLFGGMFIQSYIYSLLPPREELPSNRDCLVTSLTRTGDNCRESWRRWRGRSRTVSQRYKGVRGSCITVRIRLLRYEEDQKDRERKVRGARNFIVQ